MATLLNSVLSVPAPWAYLSIAVLVFAEAALFSGFVLPGETAVLLGGVLAATGRLSLAVLLVIVGRRRHRGQRRVRSRTPFGATHTGIPPAPPPCPTTRRCPRDTPRARWWAVLLARFTAFLRAVVPALAGLSRMPYRRFLAYNAAGGLVWGPCVVLLGYFAGHSYAAAERALGRTSAVIVAAAALLVLIAVLVRRRRWRWRWRWRWTT